MASESISNNVREVEDCDICYDNKCDDTPLIFLKCCNDTKKICVKCVNCLKTPICPYCRKPLDSKCVPYMNETTLFSSSVPDMRNNTSILSWENFLSQENIIDPSLYDDSRRMRRIMRRLRYQYRQINSVYPTNLRRTSRQQRKNYHRRQRENNRSIARQIMNSHNQSDYLGDIFFMD